MKIVRFYLIKIAEMYTSWMNATASTPINKLDGFERYSVKKGTSVSGSMTISSKQLQFNDAEKGWTVEPCLYKTTNVASQMLIAYDICCGFVLFLFLSCTESDRKSSYFPSCFLLKTFLLTPNNISFYTCIYFYVYFGYSYMIASHFRDHYRICW